MKTAILGLFALSLVVPAAAQEGSISDILAGKTAPLTVKLKEMNGDWRHVSIVSSSGKGAAGNPLGSLMGLAALGSKTGDGKKDDPAAAMMGLSLLGGMFGGGGDGDAGSYYTQGKTVSMGGETFLVVYQYKKPELNLGQMIFDSAKNGGKEPDFAALASQAKLGPESSLSMALINFKSIGTLKDVRPFDLNREIEETNKESNVMDLIAASEKDKAATPVPAAPPARTAPTKPAPAKPAPRRR